MTAGERMLTMGVGDIHGRFRRVDEWVRALEDSLGRPVDFVLAVGDVEAFEKSDDLARKASKRGMPTELVDYVKGTATFRRPIHFIGGNNENFAALHDIPQGGELQGQLRYFGRAGMTELGPLRVAFLSGIYAPTHYGTPLLPPTTADRRKQAGYFRAADVESVQQRQDIDLLLVHEWPKGLVRRQGARDAPLRADRFPWIGNPITRGLIDALRPTWVLCGHSHVPLAHTLSHPDGRETHIACLDQAVNPNLAVFWIEWSGRKPLRAGWGIKATAVWEAGQAWGRKNTPLG